MWKLKYVFLHSLYERKYADQNNSLEYLNQQKIFWSKQDKRFSFNVALTKWRTSLQDGKNNIKMTANLIFEVCFLLNVKNFLDFSRFIVSFEQIILIFPMTLTLSWRKTLSYRNQSIYFLWRSMDLYPERV